MKSRCLVVLAGVAGIAVSSRAAHAEDLVYSEERLGGILKSLPQELAPADLGVPYAIDDEVRAHVARLVDGANFDRERARRLLLDLFSPDELNIAYAAYNTKTANETFRSHHANCLGYTNLYVAMTRAAGLTSYFVEVFDLTDVKLLAEGQAVLVRGHICAGIELNGQLELYDFASDVPKKYKKWHRISDLEATAAFMNNRGVETLFPGGAYRSDGKEEARRFFKVAAALAPGYASALNNLACVSLVERDYGGARRIYESIDAEGRGRATVLANIGTTYLLDEDAGRALAYYEKALSSAPKDPFILEKIGVAEESLGRLDDAVEAFQRAAAYHGRFARPHLALGRLYTKLGKTRKAAREYRRVLEIEENPEARQALDAIGEQASDSYPVTRLVDRA